MKIIKTIGKIVLLMIIQIFALFVSSQIIVLGKDFNIPQEEAAKAFPLLLLITLFTAILIYFIYRKVNSKNYSILFLFIFSIFGIQVVMPQLDTWYFLDAFPIVNMSIVIKIILIGLVNVLIIYSLSFFIIGSKSNEITKIEFKSLLNTRFGKIIFVTALIYVAIYYLAGYYIAWQFEAVRVHYSRSSEILPFFTHTFNLLSDDPYFFPFQIFRGSLWFLFGLPIFIFLMRNKTELLLISCFIYSLLTTLQLLLPNPIMPEDVRIAHFIEGITSNALFGFVAAWMWLNYNYKKVVLVQYSENDLE